MMKKQNLVSESSSIKCNGLYKSDDDLQSVKTLEPSKNISYNAVECDRRPRGLNNLGNTCYFNSVLQCLAQTPFLSQALFDTSKPDEPVTFKLDEKDVIVKLSKWSKLTENLYTTLQKIKTSSELCFAPIALLDSLRKKYKILIGNRQHDSYELLHYLLDSVRNDDLKRYQRSIIYHYGLSMRTDPSKADENKTEKVKRFRKTLQNILLCTDHVFKGQLLNVVQCLTCGNKSEMTENFWDLSLPIVSKNNIQSILLFVCKKDCEENKLATEQENKNKDELLKFNIHDTLSNNLEVKKNLKDILIKTNETKISDWMNTSKKHPESNLLFDSDQQMDDDKILDSEKSVDSNIVLSGSSTHSSSSPQGSLHNSVFECDNPASSVSYNIAELNNDSKFESIENSKEFLNDNLSPQQNVEDNECSILTCLYHFTAPEIMTNDNKIVCKMCTELHKIKTNEDKQIYCESIQQTLISSPPAVLILHLKRFQTCSSTAEKITSDVSFPWTLDIAPYCSVQCQNKLSPGQNKLLYSLYGVVEHEGGLHSGHYFAYIKVRDQIEDDNYRFTFLESRKTKTSKTVDSNNDPCHLEPIGIWYSVSDSMVKQVTPNVVKNSQAYLMFYERIL